MTVIAVLDQLNVKHQDQAAHEPENHKKICTPNQIHGFGVVANSWMDDIMLIIDIL